MNAAPQPIFNFARALRCVRWLLAIACLLSAGSVHALCTVVCSCTVTTNNLAFGNYNPLLSANTDSAASMDVKCGGAVGLGIPYRIDITKGGGTSYATRRLSKGANTLSYNLYTDTNRTLIWGDGTSSTSYKTGQIDLDIGGLSPAQTHWVYGRIPGSQLTAIPGTNYTDSISVTLTYF